MATRLTVKANSLTNTAPLTGSAVGPSVGGVTASFDGLLVGVTPDEISDAALHHYMYSKEKCLLK